jgi:hypothetical protein
MHLEKTKPGGSTDVVFWKAHLYMQESITPTLDILACVRLTTCMASVWCERGFSTMNLVKDKLQNRLTTSLLDDLMMINLNGPGLRSPEMSQLLERVHTRWLNIRARNVTKSHRERRVCNETADCVHSEDIDDLLEQSEDSADNNVVYIAEPGFMIMPAPDQEGFSALTGSRFRKDNKLVCVAYNFDNGWQTGKWESVSDRATRAEKELSAAVISVHIVNFSRVLHPLQLRLSLASYGMESNGA